MGYWKEKQRYEKNKIKMSNGDKFTYGLVLNCTWCGFPLKLKESIVKYVKCQSGPLLHGKGFLICQSCAKQCKNCGKYFCPKHISKHKC